MAKRPFEDALSFLPPIGTNRGSRDIGHAQVGEDVVDGRAFLAEQLAKLREGKEVTTVGEGRDSDYYAPPGAALEKRIKAWGAVWDYGATWQRRWDQLIVDWFAQHLGTLAGPSAWPAAAEAAAWPTLAYDAMSGWSDDVA